MVSLADGVAVELAEGDKVADVVSDGVQVGVPDGDAGLPDGDAVALVVGVTDDVGLTDAVTDAVADIEGVTDDPDVPEADGEMLAELVGLTEAVTLWEALGLAVTDDVTDVESPPVGDTLAVGEPAEHGRRAR